MICSKCSKLPFQEADWYLDIRHCSTFAQLDESAQNGCRICSLFRRVLVEYYAHDLSCSIEEAERRHRQLDQPPSTESNGHPDSDESVQSFESAFFVRAVTTDTITDATPHSRGLRGLLYLRRYEGARDPINAIFPFVEVTSLPDSIAHREWHVVGRQIAAVPDIPLAKRWIDNCVENHPVCSKSSCSRLPSRILDLDPIGDVPGIRLLVTTNKNIHGRYATLSHCWGKSQPLKLLKETYDEFQDYIAFSSLPKTFQDAITTTRALGLRYLWIDSLCIIQDFHEDWEKQCAEMMSIYKDSFVTLAASHASGCEAGFLHPRPPPVAEAVEVSAEGRSSELVLSHYGINRNPMRLGRERDSLLSTRAWALQERLLSARVLYFGAKKAYLECCTNLQFEDCHYPITLSYVQSDVVPKTPIRQLGDGMDFLEYWTTLIDTYSRLATTERTDRFPALSGLASAFQSQTAHQYLAGIWREDMPRGLTWYVPTWPTSAIFPSTTLPEYIAPSWSWASANFPVVFIHYTYKNHFHEDLEIISASVTPAGLDPFGQLSSGYLEVSGRTQTVLAEQRPDIRVKGRRSFYVISDDIDGSILGQYAPDDASTVEGQKFTVLLLFLGNLPGSTNVAMAVKPVDGQNTTYERLGLAFSDKYCGHGLQDIFRSCTKHRMRLV